jgi:hypothetical protein
LNPFSKALNVSRKICSVLVAEEDMMMPMKTSFLLRLILFCFAVRSFPDDEEKRDSKMLFLRWVIDEDEEDDEQPNKG